MPWMMTVVSLWIRIDIGSGLHLGDRLAGGLVHGDGPVAVLDAVLAQDLEAVVLPRAGDAEDGDRVGGLASRLHAALDHSAGDDVDARVGNHVHHDRNLLDARLGQDELGQLARLLDARVAADLAVVGGAAAVLADRVEERERAAAGADHEAQVAVELLHVAGDAAMVGRIDLGAADLERGGRAGLARLLLADAEVGEQPGVLVAGVALEVDVAVEDEDAAVLGLPDRVDLGEGQVVAQEDLDQAGQDGDELAEIVAADARTANRFL